MKREKIGFALILVGIIFAAPGEAVVWWIGVALGVIGFGLVCSSK